MVVTATAVPDPDSAFTGWSGDLAGTTNPEFLTVDADKNVGASFATLFDVTATPTGPGTITLDPPGGTYPAGTVVTVSAVPDPSAVFTAWSGDLSGSTNPDFLTVDADKNLGANFVGQYTLDVTANGPGTVNLSPPGGLYDDGTSVTVTAIPDPDSVFTGWSGDLSGTTNPEIVIVSASSSGTANFATLFDVTATPTGLGTITLNPPGGTYPAGTVVTVTAVPEPDSAFTGWSGELAGTTNPEFLTVDADKNVGASFGPAVYTLTTFVTGVGSISADPPGGSYSAGTLVTLTAVKTNAGFNFTSWSGDASGTVSPTIVLMDGDKTVQASFQSSGTPACGIGPELLALIPSLGWLYRRRRRFVQ
jgi:hypothetical protein